MTDLTQYGFIKTNETDRQTDYEGHGFVVSIYTYILKNSDEIYRPRNTFVATTKDTTSRAWHVSELEKWLQEKKIPKIS